MRWLVIVKMILDLIVNLPLDAPEQEQTQEAVEQHVRECVCDNAEVLSEQAGEAGVTVQQSDWEEIIPAIVAIILFFLRRRG